jgi:dolichol-phosphate mannosyltransferase
MRTIIIVPTYNELENLPALIAQVEQLPIEPDLLIVDDNSPDGTGELADRLAADRQWLHVLHRPGKAGLGTAYREGFRYALGKGYDAIGEMDADLSHDPAYLPGMIQALEGADLVLGSRYVRGGGVRNWGILRKIISRGGSLYSQLILGLPVRDLTGGFKLFRRQLLERMDLDRVRSNGYSFQIEMTYRAIRLGCRVVEVPIVFVDRRVGSSKLSRQVMLEAMFMVPRLRFGRLQ